MNQRKTDIAMGAGCMDRIIYYFSGTGNSLYVARSIAASLEEASVQSMAPVLAPASEQRITAKAVGFVFPVYFYMMPDLVRKEAVRGLFCLYPCLPASGDLLRTASSQ